MLMIRFTYYLINGLKVVGSWLDASKISIQKMDQMSKEFKMYNSKFEVEYKEAE